MKNRIVLLLAVCIVSLSQNTALAGGMPVFWSFGGEKIIKVMDFPDTTEFKSSVGNAYVDMGVRYKQITVLFLPLWNYDVQWCGYIGSSDHYLELSRSDLEEASRGANLQMPTSQEIPAWDAFGGKIVFGILVTLYASWRTKQN